MKKLLVAIVCCLLCSSIDVYAREYTQQDIKKCNNNKMLKCDLKENLINGTVISYGRISTCTFSVKGEKRESHCYDPKIESLYKDGLQEGIEKIYYEDGSLQATIPYKNGKKDGTKEEYYEDGTLQARTSYKNDKPYGTEERYHQNGNLKERIPYKNGKKDGILKYYNEDGFLWAETPYREGRQEGIAKTYHSDGSLSRETPYKNSKREGIEKMYNGDGILVLETPYKNNKENGTQRWYYRANGKLEREIEYVDGEAIYGNRYDENGNKTKMEKEELNDGSFK